MNGSPRQPAQELETGVNQLVRESDFSADATEFEILSRLTAGDSQLWKFDRDELHDRNPPA